MIANETRPVSVSKPSPHEIQLERVFDAPRDLVWRIYTDPTLIPEWWGTGTAVDHMDVRPGGTWKFVIRDASGRESEVSGEFLELVPPERLVQTFAAWGRSHVQTFTFEDLGEQTKLTAKLAYETTEERDQNLQYGVESGATEGYKRVDAVLARLKGS